jgi:hypothetical protein
MARTMPPVIAVPASMTRKSPQLIIAGLAAGVLLMLAMASVGNPSSLAATAMTLIEVAIYAGLPAVAYLLGGVGLGRIFAPLLRRAGEPLAMQAALGIGTMLTISHLLGVLGAMGMPGGQIVAIVPPAAGLMLLALQSLAAIRRAQQTGGAGVPLISAPGLPAAALLLVAASSPPGWLWESEGRGYDVLSYHLQLPQEWLSLGRIVPLEHNVYSYLPSYVESAFYHVAVMMGVGNAPRGLLQGEAYGLLTAQWLHAGLALLGAILIARLVTMMVGQIHVIANSGEAGHPAAPSRSQAAAAGALAGALYLSIPWVIVTGSLAYNDLGVVAMMAAAMMAALDRHQPPAMRGAIVGLLIGIACGIKPTALLLAGAPAGVMMLAWAPRRQWLPLVAWGMIAGLAMLAPWLIRNIAFAGNPVFPFGAEVLGYGHWTIEQASRHAAAHRFDGSFADRLRLLVVADAADPAGPRHRGLLHPQWSLFFPLVLIAGAGALAVARTRMVAMWLCILLALQLFLWLATTHVQSRFLLPLAAPGAALFGIAAWGLMQKLRWVQLGAGAVVLIVFATGVVLFAREPHLDTGDLAPGANAMLIPGPAMRSGEFLRSRLEQATPTEQRRILNELPPEAFINLALPSGSTVYLLGEATPLYYTQPTVYATTWDRSLLSAAIQSAPGDPSQWAERLRAAGITHVLVNAAELARLERSGFLDPHLERERISDLLEGSARPVKQWPSGVWLYQLVTSGGGTG